MVSATRLLADEAAPQAGGPSAEQGSTLDAVLVETPEASGEQPGGGAAAASVELHRGGAAAASGGSASSRSPSRNPAAAAGKHESGTRPPPPGSTKGPPMLRDRIRANTHAKKPKFWATAVQPWKHGEIFFEETGRVCKYLVSPPGTLDVMEVARHLLDPFFGLPRPEMVITVQSLPFNFLDAKRELDALRREGVPWSRDTAASQDEYTKKVQELMFGICTAAIECGAWMLGFGQRAGGVQTGALFELGIRQYLSVNPEREQDLAFLGIGGPCSEEMHSWLGTESILAPDMDPNTTIINPVTGEAIDLSSSKYAVEWGRPVSHRVCYPNMGSTWMEPVVSASNMPDVLGSACLNPTLSHLLLCDDYLRKRIIELLEHVVPAVHVVVGGKSRGAMELACTKALRGAQVLLLENSGIWVNMLAKVVLQKEATEATRERRGAFEWWQNERQIQPALTRSDRIKVPSHERAMIVPDSLEINRFLVFDILVDSADIVLEKLTKALTTIGGDDIRELGFLTSEQERLNCAWRFFVAYDHNAKKQLKRARYMHAYLTLVSVVTTICAVLITSAGLIESPGTLTTGLAYPRVHLTKAQGVVLGFACSLLPLCSAFLLSCSARFAYRQRYATLAAAACHVRSVIYKYRARVGDFQPEVKSALLRQLLQEGSAADNVQPLEHPVSVTPATFSLAMPVSDEANPTPKAGQVITHKPAKRTSIQTKRDFVKPSDRFAMVLKQIHADVMSACAMHYLEEVSDDKITRMRQSLYHGQGHSDRKRPRATGPPTEPPRTRQIQPEPEDQDLQHQDSEMGAAGFSQATLCDDTEAVDNAVSLITAEDYRLFRLLPLIKEKQRSAPWLSRGLAFAQVVTFLGTAVTGALGICDLKEFIPIAVAVVAAVESFAQSEQLQSRVVSENNALATLEELVFWWNSLSMVERRRSVNKEYLIAETEAVAKMQAAIFGGSTRNGTPPNASDNGDKESANEKSK